MPLVIRPVRAALLLACLAGMLLPIGSPAADFRPDLATLAAVPRHTLPAPAVQKALDEVPRKDRPYRFAVGVGLGLTLDSGQWNFVDGQIVSWRLRVHSPGARSLSLHLTPLMLPAGARLWVYDAAGRFMHRPYDTRDLAGTELWTPMVLGDELVLEVRLPAADVPTLALGVDQGFHGYRGWKARDVPAKDQSGACNVNVACNAGAAWTSEARSVALITIANQFLCSGQLVNNVRQDAAPLFLTADHCGIGTEEGDAGDTGSINFYFGYEAAACNAPPRDRPPVPDAQGATFLADDVQSDFTLVRINVSGTQRLPANAYFSGWSALGQGSSSGASLHHPQGDEKKISLYSTAVTEAAANIGSRCPVDSWQVQWSQGTTEPGSSGGGLWDSTHRLIGVLSGGVASCEMPAGADYFGRLDRGWTASSARDGQLKAHLDPDGTCIAVVPGLDPTLNPNPGPITNGPQRCEGVASTCAVSGGGGGGGSATWLIVGLLGALALRLAPLQRRP